MPISLKAVFSRARTHPPKKEYYTLPLQDVAALFDLLNSKFNTKPNYWPSVYTPLKRNFWNVRGHTLAYFTDLKQKIVLAGDQNDPDNDRTYPASPGILYSEHFKLQNFRGKKAFGLVVQPRVTDRKALDTLPPVFGLYGIYDVKTEAFQIHRLMLPVFEGVEQTGCKTFEGAELTAEIAERGLLFGRLCTHEMLTKRDLRAKRNWDLAQGFDLKSFPAPWKRPPQADTKEKPVPA